MINPLNTIAAGLLALALTGTAHAQSAASAPERMRIAQACGWYAITSCTRSLRSAQVFARRMGTGRVIDTSSPAFPNFSPGFYCVADGPMPRHRALNAARIWRHEGVAPDAYAKSAC